MRRKNGEQHEERKENKEKEKEDEEEEGKEGEEEEQEEEGRRKRVGGRRRKQIFQRRSVKTNTEFSRFLELPLLQQLLSNSKSNITQHGVEMLFPLTNYKAVVYQVSKHQSNPFFMQKFPWYFFLLFFFPLTIPVISARKKNVCWTYRGKNVNKICCQ